MYEKFVLSFNLENLKHESTKYQLKYKQIVLYF